MSEEAASVEGYTIVAVAPFGVVVTVPAGTAWDTVDTEKVHAWVAEHKVVVFRGLAPFDKPRLPLAARRLGPLQAWAFGSVNELEPEPDAKNYLYTRGPVPLHWDGAFAGKIPRYLFFQCLEAPALDGGETVFVDTTRVWRAADERTRDVYRSLAFSYETERIVHYGGSFVSPVAACHPYTGEAVLRFAEPVDEKNPVRVKAIGLDPLASARVVSELREALSLPAAVLHHRWEQGDVVIADNHALLHGRRAFTGADKRHIRRVNVHGPERTFVDTIKDSIRIRRPEFMVAEIPILLVVALMVAKGALVTTVFAETVLLFFLLFHFGDMINCFADRDLDAVYKTHLSEAVKGLGTRNVKWQMALTVVAALALGAHLAWSTQRPDVLALVALGLALGAQYSVGPLRFKGRGLAQVLCLGAVVFVGPMLLVARILGAPWSLPLCLLIGSYGAMQQGTILVNTAEDLPEDRAAGIRTAAIATGMAGCLALATGMVALGGLGTMGAMVLAGVASRGFRLVVDLLPLVVAWAWVVWRVASTLRAVRAASDEKSALVALRARSRQMPIWITVTAWATLFAAYRVGAVLAAAGAP